METNHSSETLGTDLERQDLDGIRDEKRSVGDVVESEEDELHGGRRT